MAAVRWTAVGASRWWAGGLSSRADWCHLPEQLGQLLSRSGGTFGGVGANGSAEEMPFAEPSGPVYHEDMILPSDDNSTPEKRPKNRKSDADPLPPEEPAAEEAGPGVWLPEQLWKNLPDLSDSGDEDDTPALSQAEWREMLQGDLEAAMFELENFPDPECDFDPPDPPDLYTFHAELIKLRHALKSSQDKVLQKLGATSAAPPALPQALVVQLGILAGELRAMGNEAQAERVLQLIESFS